MIRLEEAKDGFDIGGFDIAIGKAKYLLKE
jgi:hypothetical protein